MSKRETTLEKTVIWVAEDNDGRTVQFDSPVSTSDVLNACEDLARPIYVYAAAVTVTHSTLLFTVVES